MYIIRFLIYFVFVIDINECDLVGLLFEYKDLVNFCDVEVNCINIKGFYNCGC